MSGSGDELRFQPHCTEYVTLAWSLAPGFSHDSAKPSAERRTSRSRVSTSGTRVFWWGCIIGVLLNIEVWYWIQPLWYSRTMLGLRKEEGWFIWRILGDLLVFFAVLVYRKYALVGRCYSAPFLHSILFAPHSPTQTVGLWTPRNLLAATPSAGPNKSHSLFRRMATGEGKLTFYKWGVFCDGCLGTLTLQLTHQGNLAKLSGRGMGG